MTKDTIQNQNQYKKQFRYRVCLLQKIYFYQKKKSKTEVNALLQAENYLMISESENDDEDDEASKDNETKSNNEM